MIKWFLSLFKNLDITPNKPFASLVEYEERMRGFTVEEYPHTKRYYPKYYESYFGRHPVTGKLIRLEPYLFEYAIYAKSETEADELIIEFRNDQVVK